MSGIDNLSYEERILKNNNLDFIKRYFVKNNKFDIISFSLYFGMKMISAKTKFREMKLGIETEISYTSYEQYRLFLSINAKDKILNDRKVIAPYELDIVIPSKKLAIEYNGIYWHSTLFKDKYYHLTKTKLCETKGYQLFHIFESDDIGIWKSIINSKLGLNERIFARKCTMNQISNNETNTFLNQNHLDGGCISTLNFGLFFNNKLVQVMSLSEIETQDSYELKRICAKRNVNVIGDVSKLFKRFLEKFRPKTIITYVDLRLSKGEIFRKIGFVCKGQIEPKCLDIKDNSINYFINQIKSDLKVYNCGSLIFEFDNFLI